jgi:hypothetical protein
MCAIRLANSILLDVMTLKIFDEEKRGLLNDTGNDMKMLLDIYR